MITPPPVSKCRALYRGFCGRCPRCGQGRLLQSYLKAVDHCAVCGEAYGHMRADDAPPWVTILLVGHIVVPAMLIVERQYQPPLWVQQTVWPILGLLLALLILPRSKGLVIGLLWVFKAEGSEPDSSSKLS